VSVNTLLIWDFAGLIAAFITLILALRIVWRVEKRLNKFFKILTVISGLLVLRQILRILTHIDTIVSPVYFSLLDMLPIVVYVFALWVMNSLIEDIDGEKKK